MVCGNSITAGRRGRGAALALAAALALGPALVACGDDSGGEDSNPPMPSSREPSPTSEEPTATGPADEAAAEKQIRANWKKFFDPDVPLKEKAELLQNGSKMQKVLESFNGDKRGGQVQAEVDKITFTSATAANVTYSLALKGATVLPDAKGTSVEEDGVWKVSVKTLCALVQLSGNASPGPGC
ncbi:hypothetical protein GTY65_36950 [Streptomyces sp. SID8379]|uniref:hypothetical protein n=1 Tax=unclassified Streptomyces TaxID=2593676 RepID=UPI00037B096E|nr:hypothetical protein [Streptomyces sp. SID8379]MYW69615.1 hypothetical protein [Streptomyces sp. SID8379]